MLILSQMRNMVLHETSRRPNKFFHDVGFGEFQVARSGVSYSDPKIADYYKTRRGVEDAPGTDPWLLRESTNILAFSNRHPFSLIVGEYGAGKSTALYGARTLLRRQGTPYVHVDGHYLDKNKLIEAAIGRATREGHLLIYDSLDYIAAKPSRKKHASRARPVVTAAIQNHIDAGGRVLATSHTDQWLKYFSRPDIHKAFTSFTEAAGAETYQVHGLLEGDELGTVCEVIHGTEFAGAYVPLAESSDELAARSYRMAKMFGKRILPEQITDLTQVGFDQTVRELDAWVKEGMGVDPSYQFIDPSIANAA